jgi:Rhs element Vgr protein
MAASPVVSNSDLITYAVKVNGQAINKTYQVLSITASSHANRIPFCEIELLDGSPDAEDFPISDSSDFEPGNQVEVMAGYENINQSIFQGIVVKHSIQVRSAEGPVLVVVCKDASVKMTKGRKNAYFTNQADSDIISQVIGNSGLSAEVDSTTPTLKEVIQYYATDWDFILSRADANGLVVLVDSGKVQVKKPGSLTSDPLTVTYGVDVFEFDGEIDSEDQFKSIKTSSWDLKTQAVISATATPDNLGISDLTSAKLAGVLNLSSYDLQSGAFLESDMLNSWAKAKATKTQYAKMQGTVKFQGSSLVKPGMLLELKGLGKRFKGKGFVSGVTHELRDGNWITTAELGLSADWLVTEMNVEAPLASGLLPGIQGLQVGIVKEVNNDPDKEFRVKIDLPMVGVGGDGVWARLGNFYASSGIGAFFFPEVNDEVVVGFFNDDPRFPVILGSLYSSGRAPAFTPDQPNNTKALVTRSKMKMEFQEDKKVITITTPANNQIVFSDDDKSIKLSDQNGNTIKMSSSGIDINSASAITIKAATTLTLESATGTTVKVSGGDLTEQALNISSEANISYKAQGNASAQLTASGEVKIQGAMVMIN